MVAKRICPFRCSFPVEKLKWGGVFPGFEVVDASVVPPRSSALEVMRQTLLPNEGRTSHKLLKKGKIGEKATLSPFQKSWEGSLGVRSAQQLDEAGGDLLQNPQQEFSPLTCRAVDQTPADLRG